MNLLSHLKERHIDIELHRPILDISENVATFFLWNLGGSLVGYHQYRPNASKDSNNDPKAGRYFTHRKLPTHGVWGLESLPGRTGPVFVTEGIFDAARLTEHGQTAIAVLGNNPTRDLKNWLDCLARPIVVVADNDVPGKKLAKFGHYAVFTEEKDLGDSSDVYVQTLIKKFT